MALMMTNSHTQTSHLAVLRPTCCRQFRIGPLAANQSPLACLCMLQLPVACDRPHLRPTQSREHLRGEFPEGGLFALRARCDTGRVRGDRSWLRR